MTEETGKILKPPLDSKQTDGEANWNPELLEKLYKVLYQTDLGSQALESTLESLEQKYQDSVYSELIFLLSELRFEPAEAKRHWLQINAHRDSMQERLGTALDLRVAMVSYFVEINRQLENPKIIELKVFEQTKASAYRDELTGLYNFRFFREYMMREVQRRERHAPPLSLVMIDIDNFKAYNDRNGHEAGNDVLSAVAHLLSDALRQTDVAARYGGEEFVLLLPATPKTGALLVAERARASIETHGFAHRESQPGGKLTVSIGIATYPGDARGVDELIRHADSALYVAKANGKNQVHLYGENRRSHTRVDASPEGKYHPLEIEGRPMKTLNISEGGLVFLGRSKLPVGALVGVSFHLPPHDQEISASGRVIRVEEKEKGWYETVLSIIDMRREDQRVLSGYIMQKSKRSDESDDSEEGTS